MDRQVTEEDTTDELADIWVNAWFEDDEDAFTEETSFH